MDVRGLIRIFLVAMAVLVTAGVFAGQASAGRTEPVENVKDEPIASGSGAELSLEKVESGIRTGAVEKGWTARKVEDGHMIVEIQVRKHHAVVDITYTPQSYSITYRDSAELMYDGRNIHRNYNRWIANLRRQINVAFLHM